MRPLLSFLLGLRIGAVFCEVDRTVPTVGTRRTVVFRGSGSGRGAVPVR